jgi:hypothetical protein
MLSGMQPVHRDAEVDNIHAGRIDYRIVDFFRR